MTNTMRAVLTACCLVVAPGLALAQAAKLDGAAIEALIKGNTTIRTNSQNTRLVEFFDAAGIVKTTATASNGRVVRNEGQWRQADGKLCVRKADSNQGQEYCADILKNGDAYQIALPGQQVASITVRPGDAR